MADKLKFIKMNVAQVLHMKGGAGETSYANNALVQIWVFVHIAKSDLVGEAIGCVYGNKCSVDGKVAIADLGCSCGPSSLIVTSELIKVVEKLCREMKHNNKSREYQIFLNDLPSNDFNHLFKTLHTTFKQMLTTNNKNDDDGVVAPSCYFFSGVPGSFYARLFPSNSLHFVHSSFSLHWLSQVPEGIIESNKGNICIGRTSPSNVREAYYKQFQRDFSMFLKCRAEEVVEGGRMVLTTMATTNHPSPIQPNYVIFDLLATTLHHMVLEEMIKEEEFESFNIPMYIATPLEVKMEVEKEGWFNVNSMEMSEVSWKCSSELGDDDDADDDVVMSDVAHKMSRLLRSVFEPLLVAHFGESINIQHVFYTFQRLLSHRFSAQTTHDDHYLFLNISLTRSLTSFQE